MAEWPSGVSDEDPVAAGILVEGAVRQHHRSLGAAQLDLHIDGLADVDAGRRCAHEVEIGLEGAVR